MSDNDDNNFYNGFSDNGINQWSTSYRTGKMMREIYGMDDKNEPSNSSTEPSWAGGFAGLFFILGIPLILYFLYEIGLF